jgi:hypothetical protein
MEPNLRSEHLISKGCNNLQRFHGSHFRREVTVHTMRVQGTLNKTNTGRIQLACVRSTNERGGIGTGLALPPFNPNAIREKEDILRSRGVNEDLITVKTALLRQVGPIDLVKADDLDVPDDVLRENGFVV